MAGLALVVVGAALATRPAPAPPPTPSPEVAPDLLGATTRRPAPTPQVAVAVPHGAVPWIPPQGALQIVLLDPTADPTLAVLGPLGLVYAAEGRTALRWVGLAGADEPLVRLPRGTRLRSLAAAGPRVAWVAIGPDIHGAFAGDCADLAARPMEWSTSLLDLTTGRRQTGPAGATGTVQRSGAVGSPRCGGPVAPVVALAEAGYALAQPYVPLGRGTPSAGTRGAASPAGSWIEIRRFDGGLLRALDSHLAVTALRLADDGTVAWAGIRPPGPSLPPFGQVEIAPAGGTPAAITIPEAFGALGLTADGRWAIVDASPLGGQGDPPSVWLEDVASGLARLRKLGPALGAPPTEGADRPTVAGWPAPPDWVALWRGRPASGSPVAVVAASWGGPWAVAAGPPPVWLGIAPPFAGWIGRDDGGRPVLVRLDLRRLPGVPLRSG